MGRKISSEDFNRKYLGKNYGNVNILEYIGYKNHRLYAKTICMNCMTISERRIDHIVKHKPKYCKNCKHESYKKLKETSPQNKHWAAMRINAKNRNLNWKISKEIFIELTKRKCYYCGIEPKEENYTSYSKVGTKCKKTLSYIANGIDRINSSIGYVENNVVTCCPTCNLMKNKFSSELFLEKVRLIYNNLLK